MIAWAGVLERSFALMSFGCGIGGEDFNFELIEIGLGTGLDLEMVRGE